MSSNSYLAKPKFHALMKEVLQFMQVYPPLKRVDEVYSFTLESKAEINFLSAQDKMLDMVAYAGTLPNVKADAVLRKLLEMNRLAVEESGEEPHLSVGMNPVTGVISLWSRQALAAMNVDGVVELFKLVQDRISLVREHLQEPSPGARNLSRHRGLQISLAQLIK